MATTGYLGSVGAPDWLRNEVDLWFLADVTRGVQWNARFDQSIRVDEAGRLLHQHVAAGTVDALLWVLGPVLLSPVSGLRRADRSQLGLVEEIEGAVRKRDAVEPRGLDWYYLGGVADALEFALGLRRLYWWMPLPADLRAGPPARDEYGFSS